MSAKSVGKMMRAFAVLPGDKILYNGELQTVLRIERPDYRTVLIHTDLTEAKGARPHEVDSSVRVEIHPEAK